MRLSIPGYDEIHRLDLGDAVGFVALHAVVGGHSFGGVRIKEYPSEDAALADALALSRAMTRKVLLAGIRGGGAKSVLMLPRANRSDCVRRLGEFIESLGGRYHCGADYGFTAEDDAALRSATRHVACGDLSPATARSVEIAMRAVCDPRVVAIQGLGSVGRPLAESLRAKGVRVVGADPRGGDVPPESIYDVECDVFSPCALGGVLSAATVSRLRCGVVCGGANNPLASDDVDFGKIVYVPDFIANSGATILGASRALGEEHLVEKRLQAIGPLVREAVDRAVREKKTTHSVTCAMADERLEEAKKRRR